MSAVYGPLVSVVTPVYNGEQYLVECIESVLAQTYQNWEYVIVNNCSMDATPKILRDFEQIDGRLRLYTNRQFVGPIQNHNIALSQISPFSKYAKVVSADDLLAMDCLANMVALAEEYPSAGIVGSYQVSGSRIRWRGLPREQSLISGREVCRASLMGDLDVFGTPTSVLYRSDLIRNHTPFYPHAMPHADTSACYRYLSDCDLGFVHEVLSMERVHQRQQTANVNWLSLGDVVCIQHVLEYGPVYLSDTECEARRRQLMEGYYRFLGGCVLKMREAEFWRLHSARMKELGYPIVWGKVMKRAMAEIREEVRDPYVAWRKLREALAGRHRNRSGVSA